MDALLPLDQMTADEKLRAIEAIWDDLCRNEREIPVADWQKQLLDDRLRRVEMGKARFGDWESAKRRIRDRTL